jgi:hypothetical protein
MLMDGWMKNGWMKKCVHNDDGWMDEEVPGSEIMRVDGCRRGRRRWISDPGILMFFNTPVHYAQGTH